MFSMLIEKYRHHYVFNNLDDEQYDEIQPFIHFGHYSQGDIIFQQDQSADNFYILTDGIVEILYKPYDGPELIVARLSAGSVFGWSAALGRSNYTSAARAESDCGTFWISAGDLLKICQQNPTTGVILLDRFSSLIAERLRSTHDQVFRILTERLNIDSCRVRRYYNDD